MPQAIIEKYLKGVNMITNIIEDMDGRIISKQSYINAYNSYDFSPEVKIKKEDHDFLDEFDFLLGMLIADKEKDDFVISYLNKELKKYYSFNTENAVGSYLFKSMGFLNELNIKELLFDSFNNDKPLEFKVLRYIEDILVSADIYKFFRFKDKLYFQLDKSNDLDILNKSSHETIENSKVSVGIIQNNKWVYGNRTFCRINSVKQADIEKLPLFNENITKRENITMDELKYILSDILNRKQFFFQDDVELSRDGETFFITEIIHPTSFNNKPAIEVIFLDLTEEKKIEKEFDDLNRKLEAILKLGKLAVCKIENGRIYWSREIFSILGIAPEKLNLKQSVDTIEEFFHIIDEFLLKTDIVSYNVGGFDSNDNYDKNYKLNDSYDDKNYNLNDMNYDDKNYKLNDVNYDDKNYNLNDMNIDNKSNPGNLKLTNMNLDSLDFALSHNSSKLESDLKNHETDLNSKMPNLDKSNDLNSEISNLDKPNYLNCKKSEMNLPETDLNSRISNLDLPNDLNCEKSEMNPPKTDLNSEKSDLYPLKTGLNIDLNTGESDFKNKDSDLLEYPKASSVDSEFEKLILEDEKTFDSTPTISRIPNSNSESSVGLDYLNIYDKINNENNHDLSNIYDEITRQKSESNNINVKFGIKTKNNNIKIINCDFIIYGENPLNLTGHYI